MDPPNMDMELFEALLANMQQNLPSGGAAYDDDVDDDDDDFEDDDDDDDDDDYEYGGGHEHNIHAMPNPYGGGGGEGGDLALPTMQTMSILQGLLNMNPAALPGGMGDMGGAMSGPMNSGMGGMGSPMDGGAGSFLSNMPSFLPAMNTEMAGSLAGAFAGGIGALIDGFAGGPGGGGGANISEYHEDDLLSDEEDEEDDDEDDEDDEELDERVGMGSVAAAAAGVAAVGAVGGMMASRLLGSGSPHPAHLQHPDHPTHASHPAHGHSPAPLGFTHPSFPADILSPPTAHPQLPPTTHPQLPPAAHHTSMAPSMSGGSVRSVDPLAGVPMGLAGVAAGASLLAPVVGSLLNSSKPAAKLDNSDASSVTLVGDDSLNSSTKTLPPADRPADPAAATAAAATAAATTTTPAAATAAAVALEKTHISQPNKEDSKSAAVEPKENAKKAEAAKLAATPKKDEVDKKQESVNEETTEVTETREETPKPTRVPFTKEEQDDDKASVGADSVPGSEEAVDGKSDTESVRKKTPSPVLVEKMGRLSPTGSESTPVLESASCASITDLASATESMRDSDTDNHSDAHNVTANLSDLDNDLHEAQPKVRAPPQYAVGPLPIVIEKPKFGWQSMVGLDTAKEALKSLFTSEIFPEVFEGTQGSCKGVLLFGPVGSGKTCLARALANEVEDAILIGISTAYLVTQPPHEAPKIVRYLFDHARMHSPAVILFDEVDALCYDRTNETALKAKMELLHQIRALTTLNPAYPPGINPHAFNEGIMVLGTTNQPWLLEDELRRIFTYNIHVKLPGEKAREELFRMFLQTLPHNLTDEHIKCLVAKSEGYNAADIHSLVRTVVAPRSPTDPNKYIQNISRVITYDDLATVMTEYRCRFTDEASSKYQSYIKSATHRSEERREDAKNDEKGKPKGVKKFGQRIAKSIAAALVAVID